MKTEQEIRQFLADMESCTGDLPRGSLAHTLNVITKDTLKWVLEEDSVCAENAIKLRAVVAAKGN